MQVMGADAVYEEAGIIADILQGGREEHENLGAQAPRCPLSHRREVHGQPYPKVLPGLCLPPRPEGISTRVS